MRILEVYGMCMLIYSIRYKVRWGIIFASFICGNYAGIIYVYILLPMRELCGN